MAEVIEKRQAELNKLCVELIQAKSENPPGDVSEAANVVTSFLRQEGICHQTFEPDKGHVSVVASVGEGKPSLILCGHIDVVPAGDVNKWKTHPYSGEIKQGKLYGRGATDMKGGVAAMLMALTTAKEYEKELSGKVSVASVSDEEALGPGGARWLLKNKKLAGDMCLITEPTGSLDEKYSIVGGERGTYWLKITAHGKPAHGSTPALGKNAIETLTQFLPRLKALETDAVKTPKDAEALIRNGKKELRIVAQRNRVSVNSLARTLTHYTVNLGVIAGGTKTNVVPEKCEAEVDIRVPAGGHPDGVKEFVRSMLTEELEYRVINRNMPSYTAADQPLIKAVQKGVRQVFGYRPEATYMAATTDAHHFREILGIPTAAFGPGYVELAHAYDEFVYVEDIEKAAKSYAYLIANMNALEKENS
jgi:succinyl-diaminopimelate desuccinylase